MMLADFCVGSYSPCLGLRSMSSHNFSLTTFSPSGKLVQIEYALNAVAAGKTSLGIKGMQKRRHEWLPIAPSTSSPLPMLQPRTVW